MQREHPLQQGPQAIVSILIRPEGRMQPPRTKPARCFLMFQSSSGQKAGCNSSGVMISTALLRFNPHPARRPDATASEAGLLLSLRGFNPHPARRPDATCGGLHVQPGIIVSILIRPHLSHTVLTIGVSILIRPEGRMQPNLHRLRSLH